MTTQSTGAALLRQSDIQSERLIAVLRMILAAALFLGVSGLLINLDPESRDVRRTELWWLLAGAGVYFALGAVNFWFSRPMRFRFWYSWLFNALEIAILGFQLFIDVRDPATPSLLALASPLLLVVVLVLAVQALRYRLELHIFTVAGLLTVCIAVTFHAPMLGTPWAPEVSREVQVLYSPPPNVMRMVMLTVLGLVIGTAVYRARRLVLDVAQQVEAAENLRRFLPGELSARLSDAALDDLRKPAQREITVLMMDLRGFTAMTERLGAAEVAAVLAKFRARVLDAAERHGGVVDKFVGDGAMVIFGLHGAGPSAQAAYDAWTGIRAGLAQDGLQSAASLHSGPALIGAFGDARRLEFTALGETVNIASRLEGFAKAEGLALALSQASVDAGALAPPEARDYGAVTVRGVKAPMAVLGVS
ncbi:MAG: adenylate/guanylate cyclase domain-containing protein [Pseudomonadota bacterium]